MIKVLFCAGMRRAASTWVYHVARELAEVSEEGYGVGFVKHTEFPKFNGAAPGTVVLKTHAWMEEAGDLLNLGHAAAITTLRDPRDVAASLLELELPGELSSFGRVRDVDIPAIAREFASWAAWADEGRQVFVISYERLVTDLDYCRAMIRNIADLFSFELSGLGVEIVRSKFSLKKMRARSEALEGYDRRLLMWPGHVKTGKPGRWSDVLTLEQAGEILEAAGEGWASQYAKGPKRYE